MQATGGPGIGIEKKDLKKCGGGQGSQLFGGGGGSPSRNSANNSSKSIHSKKKGPKAGEVARGVPTGRPWGSTGKLGKFGKTKHKKRLVVTVTETRIIKWSRRGGITGYDPWSGLFRDIRADNGEKKGRNQNHHSKPLIHMWLITRSLVGLNPKKKTTGMAPLRLFMSKYLVI